MGTYRISQLADRLHLIAAGEYRALPLARAHDPLPVPVACSLDADQYGTRMQDWREMLDGAHREALPDGGIRVRLPIGRAGRLAALVAAEQQCCPFFTFRLTLAGEHVELDAHAPDGALVAGLFGEQGTPC